MKSYVYYFEFGHTEYAREPLTEKQIRKIEEVEGWLLWNEKEED